MTWQGQGGAGGTGGPDDSDDATRPDWTGVTPPTPDTPDPFAPGGPLADDSSVAPPAPAGQPYPSGATGTPPTPGPLAPPPMTPPSAPPPGAPPTAVGGVSPWAPPDQSSAAWGAPPVGVTGPFAVPGAPGLVYAGAIPRAAAYIVDSFLLGIVVSIVTAPFAPSLASLSDPTSLGSVTDLPQFAARSGIAAVIGAVIEGAYFVFLWTSSGRATLGMRLFGLQVGNAPDGAKLRTDQAVKRWLAYGTWLSVFALAPFLGAIVGLAQFAWTLTLLVTTASSPTKQGLHDRFAGSAVVRPAAAGNGLALTCLILAIVIPILAVFAIISLVFMGGQMSEILSAVGESV